MHSEELISIIIKVIIISIINVLQTLALEAEVECVALSAPERCLRLFC